MEIILYTNDQELRQFKNHRYTLNDIINDAKDYEGNGWNIPITIQINE